MAGFFVKPISRHTKARAKYVGSREGTAVSCKRYSAMEFIMHELNIIGVYFIFHPGEHSCTQLFQLFLEKFEKSFV